MRVYQRESLRLKSSEAIVKINFPRFGVNKRQEIIRLLYEISKREGIEPSEIIEREESFQDYRRLKKILLQRRYPLAYHNQPSLKTYLPKLQFQSRVLNEVLLPGFQRKRREFYPKNIFVEKQAAACQLAKRFKRLFPQADFQEIATLNDWRAQRKDSARQDYSLRRETVFIVKENYDFFKKCPCTKRAQGCGYHILNLGFGCIYECAYCYLQEYTNSPGIILAGNMDDFFSAFNAYKSAGMRIGSGEFTDSLALDRFTEYSLELVDFFKKHPRADFEFKTKSQEVGNLLKAGHSGNIIVSWSLNPQKVINDNEFFSSSLEERLNAAASCVDGGYKVGFHLDPLIYFQGWQGEYGQLAESLFSKIKPEDIAWISLGALRFKPGLKRIIERRFPENKILDEEMLLGYDNKLRYPRGIRYKMYKAMLGIFSKHSPKLNMYLCMEDVRMWKDLKLKSLD